MKKFYNLGAWSYSSYRRTNYGITILYHLLKTLLSMKYFVLKFAITDKGDVSPFIHNKFDNASIIIIMHRYYHRLSA